jgi:hypothetical protein
LTASQDAETDHEMERRTWEANEGYVQSGWRHLSTSPEKEGNNCRDKLWGCGRAR